jgi:hypothetical protein
MSDPQNKNGRVERDQEPARAGAVGGAAGKMSGAGKDLIDGLPEAERAVAARESTPIDVDEELAPPLRALPHPGLEAGEFLLALRCGRRSIKTITCSLKHWFDFVSKARPRLSANAKAL